MVFDPGLLRCGDAAAGEGEIDFGQLRRATDVLHAFFFKEFKLHTGRYATLRALLMHTRYQFIHCGVYGAPYDQ